jgi:hypothetical protein
MLGTKLCDNCYEIERRLHRANRKAKLYFCNVLIDLARNIATSEGIDTTSHIFHVLVALDEWANPPEIVESEEATVLPTPDHSA